MEKSLDDKDYSGVVFMGLSVCLDDKDYSGVVFMGLSVCLDDKDYSGVVFMGLSEAIETINHDLLIAKLDAYGFGDAALKLLMKSYLGGKELR